MKASTALRLAQFAVMEAQSITNEEKLEVLKVLMDKEDLAQYMERTEEEIEAKNG